MFPSQYTTSPIAINYEMWTYRTNGYVEVETLTKEPSHKDVCNRMGWDGLSIWGYNGEEGSVTYCKSVQNFSLSKVEKMDVEEERNPFFPDIPGDVVIVKPVSKIPLDSLLQYGQ